MCQRVALKDADIALASGNCVGHLLPLSPHPRQTPCRASFHQLTLRAARFVPSLYFPVIPCSAMVFILSSIDM